MQQEMAGQAWVGWFLADGPATFIRIEPAGAGAWLASLPALGWFGMPATAGGLSGPRLRLDLGVPGLIVQLDGEVADGRATGVAVSNGVAGRFELWATWPLDETVYRQFVSCFNGGGRSVSLHLQSDTFFGAAMAVYLEGSDLVRLHPVSARRFVSERAELLELDEGPPGSGVRIRAAGHGRPGHLERTPRWAEESVVFQGPAGRIAGTLMTPLTGGPHAAIALVHGAGGGRRDFYRIFGEQFARAGLAALIYDKRGHGESDGGDGESTMFARSLDAEAALAFLRARPGIAADRVGLYGFSNGAWSVPMVSGRRDDVSFVVVTGAPGVTPARSEIHRKVFELREQGVPDAECDLAARMWELIYRYRQAGAWEESDSGFFDAAARRLSTSQAVARVAPQQYAIDNPFLSPVPPYRSHRDLLADQTGADGTDWAYDPVPDYQRTRCPVLFVVGELDQNVPAAESASRVSAVLSAPARPGSVVKIFPGAGHLMNLSDSAGLHGMTTEEASYRFHRFRFAPGFLELLRTWTADTAGRAPGVRPG
jgi:uncharacterized protein